MVPLRLGRVRWRPYLNQSGACAALALAGECSTCCTMHVAVACCMVCVAAHAHTTRPGGSVTQIRRRCGW